MTNEFENNYELKLLRELDDLDKPYIGDVMTSRRCAERIITHQPLLKSIVAEHPARLQSAIEAYFD